MCEDKECICKKCRYAPCTICRENEYPENIIQCALLKGVKECWRYEEVSKE